MTRMMIALAATAATMASLAAVNASTLPGERAPHPIISETPNGQPILLARMVVNATPLPD
ncbi:MAG: hypothetical protein ABW192_00950 [Sphingobium sp.]